MRRLQPTGSRPCPPRSSSRASTLSTRPVLATLREDAELLGVNFDMSHDGIPALINGLMAV